MVGALVGILEEGLAVVGWWEHSLVAINAHLADLPSICSLATGQLCGGYGNCVDALPFCPRK